MLKNGSAHWVIMKEGEKGPYLQEKNKKVIKDERGGQITTKFATTAPKIFIYRVQKGEYEIENCEFISKFSSKELTFHNFDKCIHNLTNKSITKE